MNWKEYLSSKHFRTEFTVTVVLLAAVLFFFPKFLQFAEQRDGVVLPDPVLALFNPVNLTWLTFGLIYLSLIIAIITLINKPDKLLLALQCYTVMVLFRIAAMYLLPLEAPAKLLPLNDPFVQLFGTGKVLTKDLFFSGHTATLFLLYLITDNKKLKLIFLACTVVVALSVLLQHVHYTIDVFAAPFFAYGSFRLVIKIKESLKIKMPLANR